MISKLAIIYQVSIDIDFKTYIFIGHTFDLEETKKETLIELEAGEYRNINLKNKFDYLMRTDPLHLGLYFRYETLQKLRQDYYPKNVLPLVMKQLEQSFIHTIRDDLRIKGKEHLLLNE